jgi:hypothetical protein
MHVQPVRKRPVVAAKWARLCSRDQPPEDASPEDASAVVPEVAFLHDKPVGPETEQRHPSQILIALSASLVCALQGTAS